MVFNFMKKMKHQNNFIRNLLKNLGLVLKNLIGLLSYQEYFFTSQFSNIFCGLKLDPRTTIFFPGKTINVRQSW